MSLISSLFRSCFHCFSPSLHLFLFSLKRFFSSSIYIYMRYICDIFVCDTGSHKFVKQDRIYLTDRIAYICINAQKSNIAIETWLARLTLAHTGFRHNMAVVSRSALLRTLTGFSVRWLSTDMAQRIAENRTEAFMGGGEKKVASQHKKVFPKPMNVVPMP